MESVRKRYLSLPVIEVERSIRKIPLAPPYLLRRIDDVI